MESVLKTLKSECAEDVQARNRQCDVHTVPKSDMALIWLVILMLVTTLIYMAWSINKINTMHHSIDSIHKEKSEASRKADLFYEALKRQKSKQ